MTVNTWKPSGKFKKNLKRVLGKLEESFRSFRNSFRVTSTIQTVFTNALLLLP